MEWTRFLGPLSKSAGSRWGQKWGHGSGSSVTLTRYDKGPCLQARSLRLRGADSRHD
jgi:hypothetical protein